MDYGRPDAEIVSIKIKRARALKDWTQNDLAEAVSRHVNTVNGWENGKLPERAALLFLAETLDQDVEALVGNLPLVEPNVRVDPELADRYTSGYVEGMRSAHKDVRTDLLPVIEKLESDLREVRAEWEEDFSKLQATIHEVSLGWPKKTRERLAEVLRERDVPEEIMNSIVDDIALLLDSYMRGDRAAKKITALDIDDAMREEIMKYVERERRSTRKRTSEG